MFLLPLLMPASCPALCPDLRGAPGYTVTSTAHHRSPQIGKNHPTQTRLCSGGEQRLRHPLFLPRLGSLRFAPLWHLPSHRAHPVLSPCSCCLLCPSARPCPCHPASPEAPRQGLGLPLLRQSKRQHALLIYRGWTRSPKDCQGAKRCPEPLGTTGEPSSERDNQVHDLPVMKKGIILTRTLHKINKPHLKPRYRLRKTVLHCIYLFNKYKESRVNCTRLFCENTKVRQRQKRAFGFNSSFIYGRYL